MGPFLDYTRLSLWPGVWLPIGTAAFLTWAHLTRLAQRHPVGFPRGWRLGLAILTSGGFLLLLAIIFVIVPF